MGDIGGRGTQETLNGAPTVTETRPLVDDELDDLRLVDAKAISEITGLPLSSVWRGTRTGLLPHYRLARTIRFSIPEVLDALKRNAEEAVERNQRQEFPPCPPFSSSSDPFPGE